MRRRIITAIVAVAILLPILWFSDTLLFPIAIAVASAICVFEMLRCLGLHKNIALSLPQYAAALVFPVLMRVIEDDITVAMISFMVAIFYAIYLFALVIWSHGRLVFKDASASYLMSAYIILAMNMVIFVRDFGESGVIIYFLIFIGAWITDVFAYFAGVFFGRHKLIEDVSPKKTIEGSIGGIIFCCLGYVALGVVAEVFFGRAANLVLLAISGIIMSIISQIGDLIMSAIKRHYGLKDFGRLFPGHGGMLDRLDSMLAVSLALATVCMFSYVSGIPLM